MMEKIYENSLFWKTLFNLMWKCSNVNEITDWTYFRKCCFHKFDSFERNRLDNPYYNEGKFQHDRVHNINSKLYNTDITKSWYMLKTTQPCYFLTLAADDGLNQFANIESEMNIYLKEKPICANLYVKASTYYNRFIDVNLDIKARIGFSADEHSTSENEWIDIFSFKTAPRLEIVKLFKRLKLDERVLDNTPTWESFGFLNTEFPESIRKDKHFLWFCDSFLSQIPTPFDFIFQYAPNSYLDYLYAVTDEDIGEIIYDYSSSSTEEI